MSYLSENMSEEEAIKILSDYEHETYIRFTKAGAVGIPDDLWYAIDKILDLYKAEKEKNGLLLANNNGYYDLKKYVKNNYISKDKIKAKIEELNNKLVEKRKEKYRTIYEIALEYYIEAYKELLEEE